MLLISVFSLNQTDAYLSIVGSTSHAQMHGCLAQMFLRRRVKITHFYEKNIVKITEIILEKSPKNP